MIDLNSDDPPDLSQRQPYRSLRRCQAVLGDVKAGLVIESVSTIDIDPRCDTGAVQPAEKGVGVAGVVGSGDTAGRVVAGQGTRSRIAGVVIAYSGGAGAADLTARRSSGGVGDSGNDWNTSSW